MSAMLRLFIKSLIRNYFRSSSFLIHRHHYWYCCFFIIHARTDDRRRERTQHKTHDMSSSKKKNRRDERAFSPFSVFVSFFPSFLCETEFLSENIWKKNEKFVVWLVCCKQWKKRGISLIRWTHKQKESWCVWQKMKKNRFFLSGRACDFHSKQHTTRCSG